MENKKDEKSFTDEYNKKLDALDFDYSNMNVPNLLESVNELNEREYKYIITESEKTKQGQLVNIIYNWNLRVSNLEDIYNKLVGVYSIEGLKSPAKYYIGKTTSKD